jgi:hypothetical protein
VCFLLGKQLTVNIIYFNFMNVSARGIKVLGSGVHGPNVDRSN